MPGGAQAAPANRPAEWPGLSCQRGSWLGEQDVSRKSVPGAAAGPEDRTASGACCRCSFGAVAIVSRTGLGIGFKTESEESPLSRGAGKGDEPEGWVGYN